MPGRQLRPLRGQPPPALRATSPAFGEGGPQSARYVVLPREAGKVAREA